MFRAHLARSRLAALLAGLVCALLPAAPAAAHAADAPAATDYRTTITGITADEPGLTVRTIEAGARLELINHTGHPIEVLGYQGEPYLQVTPDGVEQNANSPAAYLNETLTGGVAPPPGAGSEAAPVWQRLSGTPAVLWHDQRTHWTGAVPPAAVRAEPGVPHHIWNWSVPLRDGVRVFAVTGTLDWVPPPAPAIWWAAGLLLAMAVAWLGLVRPPAGRRAGAVVALVAGLGGVGYALGAGLDTGALGPAGLVRGILALHTWTLVCGLAALAAGGYALLRRGAGDLALGLSGAGLALFAGVANAQVFGHQVLPLPPAWPSAMGRVLVLMAVAGGAGLAVGSALRLRATPVTPAVPPAARVPASGIASADDGIGSAHESDCA